MPGLHIVVGETKSPLVDFTTQKDTKGVTQSWHLTVDPYVAKAAKYSLAALATVYVATTSPCIFVVSVLAGAYLGNTLDFLNNAVESAWTTVYHRHDGKTCYTSRFFLGLGAAALVFLSPALGAAYAGQRIGSLATPYIPIVLEKLGIT